MERFNSAEVSIVFDELRLKLKKEYVGGKTLTKRMMADYLGVADSVLYNPSSYRDLGLLQALVSVMKRIEIDELKDFVETYKKGKYDKKKRFEMLFGKRMAEREICKTIDRFL